EVQRQVLARADVVLHVEPEGRLAEIPGRVRAGDHRVELVDAADQEVVERAERVLAHRREVGGQVELHDLHVAADLDVLRAVVPGDVLADLEIVEAVELGIGGVAAVGAQAGDGDGGEAAIDVGEGGARHGEAV